MKYVIQSLRSTLIHWHIRRFTLRCFAYFFNQEPTQSLAQCTMCDVWKWNFMPRSFQFLSRSIFNCKKNQIEQVINLRYTPMEKLFNFYSIQYHNLTLLWPRICPRISEKKNLNTEHLGRCSNKNMMSELIHFFFFFIQWRKKEPHCTNTAKCQNKKKKMIDNNQRDKNKYRAR